MSNRPLLPSHSINHCEAQIELTDSPATKKSDALRDQKTKKLLFPLQSNEHVRRSWLVIALLGTVITGAASCASIMDKQRDVRPLVLRDVPAQRLAYRLEPDVVLPAEISIEDANDKIEAI